MVARKIANQLWARLSVVVIVTMFAQIGVQADTPITPNASPQAQALLAYLHDISGKKLLSGQQESWRGTNELGFELSHIQHSTGKLPAILGLDASSLVSGRRNQFDAGENPVLSNAIDWVKHRNGIVTFCWHWNAPIGKRAFYTKETDFDAARAVSPGTAEYKGVLSDLDHLATQLQKLQAARVPVLWRPLHEANGRWFWWGAAGPDACKKLWRLMFERLVTHHGLTNLIWVFSPGAGIDLADWYPGDAYVDIIGQDHYPLNGSHDSAKQIHDELAVLGGGVKLIAMSENGPIPDPMDLERDKVNWLFFVTWGGAELTKYNSPDQLRQFYNHPRVVNLGDMPDLKTYGFPKVGPPTTLAFSAAPHDFGIGSPNRRALTVLIQDKQGQTVRPESFDVTLTSTAALGERSLSAHSLNGVAPFPDLTFDRATADCQLVATANGMRSATSAVFSVGPGSGIVRETWTTSAESQSAKTRQIVQKAFETPVQLATNFQARFVTQLIPPQTGQYQFWIANEDRSELWLSPDATAESAVQIAEVRRDTPYAKWPHTHEAASQAITLKAGQRYHFEVRQTQSAGSTHLAVRWRLPDGSEESPIPASRLALPESAEKSKKYKQTTPP